MANQIAQNEAVETLEESYDTSDPKAVNTVRKKAARTRADRLRFIEAAMTTEEGRAWFYDILLFCHILRNPFSDDPYVTAFKCGELNVGTRILDDIQTAAPNNYLKMIGENKSKNG